MAQETLTLVCDVTGLNDFVDAARDVLAKHRRARLPANLFVIGEVEADWFLTVTITPTRRAAEWLRRWQER